LDITWYGLNCFRITERGQISIVTDPFQDGFGLEAPKLKGDVVTVSHDAPEFNNVATVKGTQYTISTPGEYEVGGVFIYGTAMHTHHEGTDQPIYNIAHSIQYGQISVAHLGRLKHVPEQSTLEQLGDIQAVILPVGGEIGLNANQAAEVIAMLEPSYIIPSLYAMDNLDLAFDSVERFLKVMGVSKVQQEDVLRITSGNLPEQPQVIVLNPQTS
jgi:L-ascorbate metabolism protein UlaG (beta-lactamase superfamily)